MPPAQFNHSCRMIGVIFLKKILFVFPLLLIFVLPCLVPLRSSAAFADDLYDDGYYTAHASQAQNYFEFCYTDEEGKHTLYWDNIVFDISLSDIDIVSYNGDYWIYVSTSSSFIVNRASYDNPTSYRDIETESDFVKLVGGIHVSSYGSVELFKYSSTGSHHIESEPFFTATVSNDNLAHIKTNLFEFAGFAEPELSVSFSPINFTGTISDLLEYQGPSLDGSPISTKLNQIALHLSI